MDRGKLLVLFDMANLQRANNWIRVEAGRELRGIQSGDIVRSSYRAREHVSRLVWFDLACIQQERSSLWRITKKGILFIKGEIKVPLKILCSAGEVKYESWERISVGQVKEYFNKEYWVNYPWSEI